MVTIRIPAPSSMLVVNLLGLLGLAGLSVAVGGLTHNWWWSVAVASVFAIGLSIVAATHAAAAEQAKQEKESGPATAPTQLQRAAS